MPPTHALVREPSPRLEHAELTFVQRSPIDISMARFQHAAYVHLLVRLGLQIVEVAAAADLADGAFVEDAVVVVDDLAVLTRPGAPSRQPEIASVRATVEGLGLRTASIAAPGTLDGGDVLQIGSTVFVGQGARSNLAALEQLSALVAPLGRRVVPVAVTGCLHLKTGATALPDGTLLASAGLLDVSPFVDAGLEVVEPPEVEGADLLLVGEQVVLSAAAPQTAELIRSRGFATHEVEIGEFEKAEAGPTCLSVLVRR